MENKAPVICPWCGGEMTYNQCRTTAWYGYYECSRCYSAAPRVPLRQKYGVDARERAAAHAAAMKRHEPTRKPVEIYDVGHLGVPYFAEYKGVYSLLLYVTGDGIKADFAAARKLGWEGKTLGEFWEWEKEHGKLQVRLWEAKHSPPTDEERAAAKWDCDA